MALEEHVNGPDDFDALLRRELRVVPSPTFVPGARARIAAERIAGGDWPWRLLVPAGAIAVACAAGLSLQLAMRTVTPMAPAAPALPMLAPVAVVSADAALEPGLHGPAPAAVRAAMRVREQGLPSVIVDTGQHAAIRSVLSMVEEGTLSAEAFVRTIPSSFLPITDGVRPIEVPALEVTPIPVGGVLQAGTDR